METIVSYRCLPNHGVSSNKTSIRYISAIASRVYTIYSSLPRDRSLREHLMHIYKALLSVSSILLKEILAVLVMDIDFIF